MSEISVRTPASATAVVVGELAPIMITVLLIFLVIGLAMPVLPLHVHQRLGMSAFVVGLVAGAQFTGAPGAFEARS